MVNPFTKFELGCGSVVEFLLSMYKVLGLSPILKKRIFLVRYITYQIYTVKIILSQYSEST